HWADFKLGSTMQGPLSSSGEFLKAFTQYKDQVKDAIFGVSKGILAEINEENVYRDKLKEHSFGGHADENGMEFFASFMNSLYHPDWEQKGAAAFLERFTPATRKDYLNTLRALDKDFQSLPEFLIGTPRKGARV